MTPDEIRVAIRLLGQKVYWNKFFQVHYEPDKGYVIRYHSLKRGEQAWMPLFGKRGGFTKIAGGWVGSGKRFKKHEFGLEGPGSY